MKSLVPSLFLFALLSLGIYGCSGSKANVNATPESVGEQFFQLLVNNNPDGMKELFPGEKDWESMAKITAVPEDKMETFKEDFTRRIEMTQTNEVARFKIIQDRVNERGLDLKQAKLDEVVKVREWVDEGLSLASVEIRFHIGEEQHKIFLGNIGQLERGWFMNRVPNWKPGQE